MFNKTFYKHLIRIDYFKINTHFVLFNDFFRGVDLIYKAHQLIVQSKNKNYGEKANQIQTLQCSQKVEIAKH